jgi:hypothetical protein
MINLTLYNNLWIKVDTEETDILQLINEHFSYRPEGFRFNPQYKCGNWDGYIRLFNSKNRILPYGLLFDLIRLLKNNNYDIDVDDKVKDLFNYSNPVTFNYDLKFYPRYYQDEIIKSCIKYKKCLFSSATASGKCVYDVEVELELDDEIYNKYFSDYKNLEYR